MKKLPSYSVIASVFSMVLLFGAFPLSTHAATVVTDRIITVSSSTPDNAYYAAGSVSINAPLPEDLCAAAGTITVSAPIGGDAMLAGGTVDIQRPVAGDVRVAGGKINVEDTVGGDLMAAGGFVTVSGKAKDTHIVGGTVELNNGSNGNVQVYGADVYLAGTFNGDVQVVASDKITVADGTVIHGAFKYNAPQQTGIPASAQIDSGVNYIGSAPYLPTVQQAKTFAVAGLWVFFVVRFTAVLVVVGLVAGLFPELAERVIERTLKRSVERFILLALLGFAGFVVVPILLLILAVSVVGLGLALFIGAGYLVFLLLAYAYSFVLAGSILMRGIRYRTKGSWDITWRGALLGVVVLSVVGFIPVIGTVVKFVLCAAAGGALLTQAYTFAFSRNFQDLSEF